jgi:hypothetical protein
MSAPPLFRFGSNFSVLLNSFSLLISLGGFYSLSPVQATAAFIAAFLLLIASIGLRLMKKWSVYLFSLVMIFPFTGMILMFMQGEVLAPQQLLGLLVPLVFYATAALYWRELE